jgi:RND family efflux transporter MFP subunit
VHLQEFGRVETMKLRKLISGLSVCLIVLPALQGCGEKQEGANEQLIRGLRAYTVSTRAESRVRRFPSILQPAAVSVLSFEIAGQLRTVNLQAGQKVELGDLLAEIDPRSLQTQVEQASAAVQQADAQVANAEADFQRKQELLKRGVSTQATFDQSKANLLTTQAQLDQARRQLELANHNLDRSKLLAPFAGTIARVEVKSFAQVTAGQPILTLYSDDRFEMSFLVPAATFQSLRVGQEVEVKVADLPALSLKGDITELGSKAEQVSAFPVVVRLENSVAGLNAGMSVEVAVEEPLVGGGEGFLLPLSVLSPEGGKELQGVATIFVYDKASSTVKKRQITVGGVRDNYFVATAGVGVGDLVASAGVSYLGDGQKVKLLPLQE